MSKSSRRRARTKARKQAAGRHVRTEPVRVKAAAVAARISGPVNVLPRRSSIGTIGAIALRELVALLRAPLGWGIAAVFLFFGSGFGFIGTVIAGQQASFDGIYQVINGLLTLALAPLPQLAIAWAISNPAVDVAIVGARHPEHLNDPASAADIRLGSSDRDEIDAILAKAVEIVGPAPEAMP